MNTLRQLRNIKKEIDKNPKAYLLKVVDQYLTFVEEAKMEKQVKELIKNKHGWILK
jgi:hypothetical protein